MSDFYRKKPIEIEAKQIPLDADGKKVLDILNWVYSYDKNPPVRLSWDGLGLVVETLEGPLTVGAGWWIIRGIKGEFYPIRNDIFQESYDKVEAKIHPIFTGDYFFYSMHMTYCQGVAFEFLWRIGAEGYNQKFFDAALGCLDHDEFLSSVPDEVIRPLIYDLRDYSLKDGSSDREYILGWAMLAIIQGDFTSAINHLEGWGKL